MLCLGRIHPPSSGDGVQFSLYSIPYEPDHAPKFSGQDIRVVEHDTMLHSVMSNFSVHYMLFDIYKIITTEVAG
jgi:hypothetical protein